MSIERDLLKRFMIELTTEEDVVSLFNDIKECLAQPEHTAEPVAWKVIDKTNGEYMFSRIKPMERSYKYDVVIPLYTAPPKREPLSDEEIVKLWANKSPANEFECVRLVEKAHGIGGGE
jgi:hypothetical protein